jgi:anaerobic magnesium-protoporphyrin IX monomethyl ester cyclase
MRIILFHPRGYSLNPCKVKNIGSLACIMPPVGLASIASVLRNAGHNVSIIDAALKYTVSNSEWSRLLTEESPDMIGFSATTAAFLDAYDICRRVKDIKSDIKTVFGGVHVSWGKDKLLKQFPAIDYIIAGEGEIPLKKLADGIPLKEIERLYFRDNETIISGDSQSALCNLDDLPFPAYDLLDGFPRKYLMPLFSYPKHPGANIISSRGCVYECPYCDRSVFGKSFRWNSPEYTYEQMLWLNKDFGVRHFNFYDDLFTLNKGRVEKLCSLLSEKRLPVTFNCIVRAGHIDKELTGLLKRGNCWMVSIGIESGDPAILAMEKQGLTIEKIRQDVEQLHASGLWVKGLFMSGFPSETVDSIVKTREFAMSLPLKDANLTVFTPFPGSPIYSEIEKSGTFDNDWEKMNCVDIVFIPKEIGNKEILKFHYGEFYRSFYNRPFMRKYVYPRLMVKSLHSMWRLGRHGLSFLRYSKSL